MSTLNRFFLLAIATLSMAFVWNAPQDDEKLKDGDKAPSIKTEDVLGNPINLKKMVKEQKVLLVFLRHAWCPICNHRTHELIKNYDALKEKGYEVVVFYQSPSNRLKQYAEDYKLPFHVVADPDQEYYKLYKLEYHLEAVLDQFQNNKKVQELAAKGMELIKGEEGVKKYKTGTEKGGDLIPGDFVVGNKGVIEKAYYGEILGDHLELSGL